MKTKANRRGRPEVGSADKKSAGLLLKMTEREKKGFRDAADLAGTPLSVWIRERLRRVAAKELNDAGRVAAFLPGLNKSA